MARTTSGEVRRQARRRLDERTAFFQSHASDFVVPNGGWLQAIREALGMSSKDLAARMRVAESTVLRLEASERADTAQLSSLRRAAAALDCDLVYALVPRQPLEGRVQRQARRRATDDLGRVKHTMLLENQTPSKSVLNDLLDDATGEWVVRPGLWSE